MHEPLGLILNVFIWTFPHGCEPEQEKVEQLSGVVVLMCVAQTLRHQTAAPTPKKNSHLMTSLTGDEVACGCGPNGLLKSSVSLSPSLFLWSLSLYHPPITHLSSFSHYLLFIHFYVSINLYIHPSSIYTSNYPSIYLLFYLSIIDLFIYRRGVKLIFCCGPHRSCGVLRRAVVTANPNNIWL